MTDFGTVPTQIPVKVVMGENFDEITGEITTAANLEDIAGLTFDLTVPTGQTATIRAIMSVECASSGANNTGGWAVNINGTDKQEVQRTMSTANEQGSVTAQGQTTGMTAGTYTVKGRHRRVSGAQNVQTDVAQLYASVILE